MRDQCRLHARSVQLPYNRCCARMSEAPRLSITEKELLGSLTLILPLVSHSWGYSHYLQICMSVRAFFSDASWTRSLCSMGDRVLGAFFMETQLISSEQPRACRVLSVPESGICVRQQPRFANGVFVALEIRSHLLFCFLRRCKNSPRVTSLIATNAHLWKICNLTTHPTISSQRSPNCIKT